MNYIARNKIIEKWEGGRVLGRESEGKKRKKIEKGMGGEETKIKK